MSRTRYIDAVERAGILDRAQRELEIALEQTKKAARTLSEIPGGPGFDVHTRVATAIRSLHSVIDLLKRT